ncbi:MAG: hypothetical protein NZ480_06420, partial [Bdellovibrionaceae bacterium]|nr:hypothetical protein [Pseudobdellovibrionaceae bacterium]MDW8191281.1 hypothetical protein [Pseudobdellovibrionaceae bacterium]
MRKLSSINDFYHAISAGKVSESVLNHRIWLLAGDDCFFRREIKTFFKRTWWPPFPELNVVSYFGEEIRWDHLEDELITYPFAADHKLIFIEFD